MLNRHFSECGASYPIGGASEIAYSIIPVIESTGGRVLVRANVTGKFYRIYAPRVTLTLEKNRKTSHSSTHDPLIKSVFNLI